jgi:hypothetical protein
VSQPEKRYRERCYLAASLNESTKGISRFSLLNVASSRPAEHAPCAATQTNDGEHPRQLTRKYMLICSGF